MKRKGKPWFPTPSSLAFGGRYEHLSDAAVRTLLEIVGIAQNDASDGVVEVKRVRKQCNSPRLRSALSELEENNEIELDDEKVSLTHPEEWVTFATEIEAERANWRTKNARRYARSTVQDETLDASMFPKDSDDSALESQKTGNNSESNSERDSKSTPRETRSIECRDVDTSSKSGVQRVLKEAISTASETGVTLQDSFKARLGKEAKELLSAGADAEMLRGAVRVLIRKNKPPTALGYLLRDMQRGKRGRSDGSDWGM